MFILRAWGTMHYLYFRLFHYFGANEDLMVESHSFFLEWNRKKTQKQLFI